MAFAGRCPVVARAALYSQAISLLESFDGDASMFLKADVAMAAGHDVWIYRRLRNARCSHVKSWLKQVPGRKASSFVPSKQSFSRANVAS